MAKDELRVSLAPPRLSALPDLARMVEAFAGAHGLPESKTYMLNLALDELVANAVNYGLAGVAEPRIEIVLWASGPLLVLTMVDNGQRFDPTERAAPDLSSPLHKRPVGGLGLHLVGTFADRVTYQFTEGRNQLTLEHSYRPTEQIREPDVLMDIEVLEERHDGVLVLSPVGRLDSGNVQSFETSVLERIVGDERRLVFDFSRLDFISSSNLRVLLVAAKTLKTNAGTVVVCGMRRHIEHVFRLAGFDRLITVATSRAAVLDA